MSPDLARADAVILNHSEVETARFGFRICRGEITEVDEAAILSAILDQAVDIAMIRMPSARQPQLARLDRTGLPYLVADTQVRGTANLTTFDPRPLRNADLDFAACRVGDAPAVTALARAVFECYDNHYCSNPMLRRKDILDAFVDWASRYVAAEEQGRMCWIVRRNGNPVAFITGAIAGEKCEDVLGGVHPLVRGGGVYRDMIRFTQRFFKDKGCSTMTVSTQAQNTAVQRVWWREGFEPADSVVTLHVNALLSRSVADVCESDVTIVRNGVVTPSSNHESRLAMTPDLEGLDAVVRRYLESRFPGSGAVLTTGSFVRLNPFRGGDRCRVSMSLPYADDRRGIYVVLAKGMDEAGGANLLHYSRFAKPAA